MEISLNNICPMICEELNEIGKQLARVGYYKTPNKQLIKLI